jgi:pyruvate/2-oxoglutarate dehydrogenase complex dihydrolipoamide dehydrogenase (E3) component
MMILTLLKPDICVIGAGSAGLSVAAASAMFGVPVVLVEKSLMGGDCLNVGCVPSKALIAAGARAHDIRNSEAFGISVAEPQINMARVRDHVQNVIKAIAPTDSRERFRALGVQVLDGEGAFEDGRTLVLGTTRIQARRFVIATGSRAAIPPIPGLDSVPYLTNETIFTISRKIDTLAIIGGGPIGLEIAQAHARLGARVVVFEAGRALGREDPEIAAIALAALRSEGITIHEGIRIDKASTKSNGIRLNFTDADGATEILDASHLLVAAGRTPVMDGLGLDKAEVKTGKNGIVVDRGLRTSNRRIFAIGDCADVPGGDMRFTHVANYHAGLVLRSALFRLPVRVNPDILPRVTYTDPEIAAVGLSEADAREKHGRIGVLRWPFAENDRAQGHRTTTGHVKVITGKRGRILGCTIVGPHAGELITPWTIALTKRLTLSDLAGVVVPYPTLSEINRRVAVSSFASSLSNVWLRRLLSFLRSFG